MRIKIARNAGDLQLKERSGGYRKFFRLRGDAVALDEQLFYHGSHVVRVPAGLYFHYDLVDVHGLVQNDFGYFDVHVDRVVRS